MMSCQTSMPHNACYCTIHNEKAMSIDDTMKWTKKSPKENIISISLVVKKRVCRKNWGVSSIAVFHILPRKLQLTCFLSVIP